MKDISKINEVNGTILFQSLCKPPIYTKSEAEFWNDEYISKQMLEAHLNPDFEGASRKLDFIEKSVAWIAKLVPSDGYPSLLDIGCGPGIYAERFDQQGYQVTGMDYSKRSIEYAKQSAYEKKLDITYYYQNYLNMDLQKCFDFCTMIYCDYGALSTEDRKIVMKNVYEHLKPGGKFLFDVFTPKFIEGFKESQSWILCKDGGFWREEEYLELDAGYKYGDNVTLKFVSVVTKDSVTPYYIWDTYFTKEMLMKEAQEAGFKVDDVYGDIAGSCYSEDGKTMAILLEK